MIPMSRKRGLSEETIIDTAVVNTNRSTRKTGNSSHDHIGPTPKDSVKTNTTIKFKPRLKALVRTTASGITRRGNWVLRTTLSWLTIDSTAVVVASWKKVNSTMLNNNRTG